MAHFQLDDVGVLEPVGAMVADQGIDEESAALVDDNDNDDIKINHETNLCEECGKRMLNHSQRNVFYFTIFAFTSIWLIYHHLLFILISLTILSVTMVITHIIGSKLRSKSPDNDLMNATLIIHPKAEPYSAAITTINNEINNRNLPSDYNRRRWHVFSRINQSRHGAIMFIICDKKGNVNNRYNPLRIDLFVDENDGWFIESKVEAFTDDFYGFINKWVYLGQCKLSLPVLKDILEDICKDFGDYNLISNNCQDFIQELTLYVDGISTVDTDRLSFVYIVTLFLIYIVSIHEMKQIKEISFGYISSFVCMLLFFVGIHLIKVLFDDLTLIMVKFNKLNKTMKELIKIDQKVFLIGKITWLTVRLFCLDLFIQFLPIEICNGFFCGLFFGIT